MQGDETITAAQLARSFGLGREMMRRILRRLGFDTSKPILASDAMLKAREIVAASERSVGNKWERPSTDV